MATLARPAPAPQDTAKTNTDWLLVKVRKILDSTPACEAYTARKYGTMFEILGSGMPPMRNVSDKAAWGQSMDTLMTLREQATVGEVLDHLSNTKRPRLPDPIRRRERELLTFDRSNDEPLPDSLVEIEKLRAVQYLEIKALSAYHNGFSPFETQHGVKGAEFENVLAVIGRGWNRYNFGEMLELASQAQIPSERYEAFERNRNLFYVACSRPKCRLALVFTQELGSSALDTLTKWFGQENIAAVQFN